MSHVVIPCVWEHNGDDTLLWACEEIGACTRGASCAEAAAKMPAEIAACRRWRGLPVPSAVSVEIVEEWVSALAIGEADSDVLLAAERAPLTRAEYDALKALCLRSAADFLALYTAVPDKGSAARPPRQTFYGAVPRTAEEMYTHTKNVNAYYFAEIDVAADNEGDVAACRQRGFAALERQPDFLQRPVVCGSYGEEWSLRKVLRRFIWHDRIHAKAMWRLARTLWGADAVPDPFAFEQNT